MDARTPTRMVTALLVAPYLAIAFPLSSPVSAATDTGDGWAEADGGSLGAVSASPPAIWCVVDGSSLGLPDPAAACGGESH